MNIAEAIQLVKNIVTSICIYCNPREDIVRLCCPYATKKQLNALLILLQKVFPNVEITQDKHCIIMRGISQNIVTTFLYSLLRASVQSDKLIVKYCSENTAKTLRELLSRLGMELVLVKDCVV